MISHAVCSATPQRYAGIPAMDTNAYSSYCDISENHFKQKYTCTSYVRTCSRFHQVSLIVCLRSGVVLYWMISSSSDSACTCTIA